MYKKYFRKYGLQISFKTKIGYGLYIGHGIGIIISPSAKIGNNCNLSQFTTIGTNHKKSAIIGDNVYIGPSVCIVEDVNIGNNVSIGAGAVVVKDVPENATVAGVPAKILNYNNPGRYVNNRWERNENKI
jgi:serine O-acetyltransferase